jgi:hypothetical protein
MTTEYSFIRDINGYNGLSLIPSNQIWTANLAAATATPLLVPSDAAQYVVYINVEPAKEVWMATTGTAAIPAGAAFAASNSFLINGNYNPTPAFIVNAGITLSFISTAGTAISVMFFKVR